MAPSVGLTLTLLYTLLVCSGGATELPRPVVIRYLLGVQRLSERNVRDFYFTCNVVGPNVYWKINGTTYRFFLPGELQVVHKESLPNFNFTTTLLSSMEVNGIHHLDSVMIVSVVDNNIINVGCLSDTGSAFSRSSDPMGNNVMLAVAPDNTIRLWQLWNTNVRVGIGTRGLMCEADCNSQSWETDKGDLLGFDTRDRIGSRSSFNNSFLSILLLGVSPQRLLSIFLVSDPSITNISCRACNSSVNSDQLHSPVESNSSECINSPIPVNTFSPATKEIDVTKHSSAKTERGDERTTSPFHVLTVAVAVIVIPIALVVPKVLVVLVLHCKIKNRKKNTSNGNIDVLEIGLVLSANESGEPPGYSSAQKWNCCNFFPVSHTSNDGWDF